MQSELSLYPFKEDSEKPHLWFLYTVSKCSFFHPSTFPVLTKLELFQNGRRELVMDRQTSISASFRILLLLKPQRRGPRVKIFTFKHGGSPYTLGMPRRELFKTIMWNMYSFFHFTVFLFLCIIASVVVCAFHKT